MEEAHGRRQETSQKDAAIFRWQLKSARTGEW